MVEIPINSTVSQQSRKRTEFRIAIAVEKTRAIPIGLSGKGEIFDDGSLFDRTGELRLRVVLGRYHLDDLLGALGCRVNLASTTFGPIDLYLLLTDRHRDAKTAAFDDAVGRLRVPVCGDETNESSIHRLVVERNAAIDRADC